MKRHWKTSADTFVILVSICFAPISDDILRDGKRKKIQLKPKTPFPEIKLLEREVKMSERRWRVQTAINSWRSNVNRSAAGRLMNTSWYASLHPLLEFPIDWSAVFLFFLRLYFELWKQLVQLQRQKVEAIRALEREIWVVGKDFLGMFFSVCVNGYIFWTDVIPSFQTPDQN